MTPPPPRLPASGYVTASVNAIATAASTALPPSLKTRSAASALYSSATANADAVNTGFAPFVLATAGVVSRKPTDIVASATIAAPATADFIRNTELIDPLLRR